MPKHRIEVLDGFRAIAIISVLMYHFTGPWVKYPHQDFFLHIFKYGYLGVHLFFMISGFVICYTLENTPNLLSFYRNRFARLFPAMLLCTVLIFLFVRFVDDQVQFKSAHDLKNVLPGLTFINPQIWSLVTGKEFKWLNGSFWSIWVEVQFYVIASAVYFANRKNFPRNLFIVCIAVVISKYIPIGLYNTWSSSFSKETNHILVTWRKDDEIFNITFWITWFFCGSAFYHLYNSVKKKTNTFPVLYLIVSLLCLTADTKNFFKQTFIETMIACLIMVVLFLLMIYKERSLFFLKNSFISRIGIVSYSIYLIHEQIGTLLIQKTAPYFGSWSWLTPLPVIVIFMIFGELSYRFYESKVSKILRG
jgi:peptidoglycan/LPS O-acetylase OafA/YrhL